MKHSKSVTIFIKPELLERIEDFQFKNRFKNRNKAIIDLLETGLETRAERDQDTPEKK